MERDLQMTQARDKALGNSMTLLMLIAVFFGMAAVQSSAAPLLPDMIVDTSTMSSNNYDASTIPGRLLFRFESSLANIGPGDFLIMSTEEAVADDFESVNQWIYQDDLTPPQPVILDKFRYRISDAHMYGFDWVAYRIREVLPGDGVGPILRTGQKPFVRLTSSRTYDSSIPNYVPSAQAIRGRAPAYRRQGVSVGWTDIYIQQFELQWVDITGLARGEYWLEVEVNFDNLIQEADTTNNVGRIKVTLDHPLLPTFMAHRADYRNFGNLDLTELLRVIQLFNSDGYECAENTEDGFSPGGIDDGCAPHSSDYQVVDRKISLSELLRAVQLYNSGLFLPCEGGEDGYCPQG